MGLRNLRVACQKRRRLLAIGGQVLILSTSFCGSVHPRNLLTDHNVPMLGWVCQLCRTLQMLYVGFVFSDLLHIESNSRTPEKMALALLDYLFDRDTQACSNLSGLGRHGKKKLDPLFIYGMRCE